MKANPLKIIFVDEHIIVCEKPSGMLSIPDRFDQTKPNVYHELEAEFGQVWIVHRIDRETSGILVFARNEDAHRALNQQFLDRTVEKIYLALVEGRPMPPTGEINKAIAQRREQRTISARVKAGGVHEDDIRRGRLRAERDASHASARHFKAYAAKIGILCHARTMTMRPRSIKRNAACLPCRANI